MLDPELVEAARDDEVDQLLDRVRAVVEARRQEEDRRAGLLELEHVAQVDLRKRRLPRTDDQPALLLQRHRGGAMDQVRHSPRGDRPERPHRAGANHVGVDLRGATRVRRLPVALGVDGDAVCATDQALRDLVLREREVTIELGRKHLVPRARDAESQLAVRRGERLNEPCGVRGARGAGYA